MSTPEAPDQALLSRYDPETLVKSPNGMEFTLAGALEAEELFCTANKTKRLDPYRRAVFLAELIHAGGSLLPEDEHLLTTSD